MTAYWTHPEHAEDYEEWVNDLLRGAPESYGDDVAAEAIVTRYVTDLKDALLEARQLLQLADEFFEQRTGSRLTWQLRPDCQWAQRVLAGACCPVRFDAGEDPWLHPMVTNDYRNVAAGRRSADPPIPDTPYCCRPYPEPHYGDPCTWPETDFYEKGPGRSVEVQQAASNNGGSDAPR